MSLEELRKKIDGTDRKLLELLNRRAEYALEIGKIKSGKRAGFHAPDREREILENISSMNRGPLSGKALLPIFREIMSACLLVQKSLKIAYLGPEATFTHLAAIERFGQAMDYIPAKSVEGVFREVEKGNCDYGVVPVENSIEGVVTHTLDMFIDSELKICGEISLLVNQQLLSKSELGEIARVYSHPHAFPQCRNWLANNLSGAELKEVASTAEAARLASREPGAGAIASKAAASIYNLNIVASDIEDAGSNVTRFIVISDKHSGRTGNDKTSVMFSIKDRVGALHDMLNTFRKHGINLTKIESRPSRRKAWDYFFFVDLEGHLEEDNVKKAMGELEKECAYLKFLGSYPSAAK